MKILYLLCSCSTPKKNTRNGWMGEWTLSHHVPLSNNNVISIRGGRCVCHSRGIWMYMYGSITQGDHTFLLSLGCLPSTPPFLQPFFTHPDSTRFIPKQKNTSFLRLPPSPWRISLPSSYLASIKRLRLWVALYSKFLFTSYSAHCQYYYLSVWVSEEIHLYL